MTRYHLRPNGDAGRCTAVKKPCPFADAIHGDSMEDVYEKYGQSLQGAIVPAGASKVQVKLNEVEEELLGTVRTKLNGEPSTVQWPSREQWPALRQLLVSNSVKSNPKLDPKFTAYTPGETVALMELPEVKAWHEKARNYRVPEGKIIVFVPCAKTKPWDRESSGSSSYYSAYHKLADEFPHLHFMTISEPLGLVSMDDWGDFLQYDNPGLFHDPAQRSSLHRSGWVKAGYDAALATPFDETAYRDSISTLASVISPFLAAHGEHRTVSLVDGRVGEAVTTHGAMLSEALQSTEAHVQRFPKRGEARVSPHPYLHDIIASNYSKA